jgi:hypothetical protein
MTDVHGGVIDARGFRSLIGSSVPLSMTQWPQQPRKLAASSSHSTPAAY